MYMYVKYPFTSGRNDMYICNGSILNIASSASELSKSGDSWFDLVTEEYANVNSAGPKYDNVPRSRENDLYE